MLLPPTLSPHLIGVVSLLSALLWQVHKKLADGTFGAEEGEDAGDGLKTSGSRAMDAYRMKQTGATATFDPTRGGAKVNGTFQQKHILFGADRLACSGVFCIFNQ